MPDEFPIIIVTPQAYELSKTEAMGSNYKFWFEHPELGHCLYKQARLDLGEDWAEKVASELCELLGIPHANYELVTTSEGTLGVVSSYFLPNGGTLVHGNELLTPIVPNYPTFATYNLSQHTIDLVLRIISDESVNLPIGWTVPSGIQKAVEVFVGYLLLDAWIGNGESHHENWGVVRNKAVPTTSETAHLAPSASETVNLASTTSKTAHLAPSYDHASSLGRDLSDRQRQKRSVEAYANKCFSAFYDSVDDKKPLKTIDVFDCAARRFPNAAHIWLERLESISKTSIVDIFHRIPNTRISPIAAEFAQKIIEFNQHRLLNLRKTLP
jgi:hypothetical protein